MEIHPAAKEDLPLLQKLYEEGRQKMRRSGNLEQWTGGYPKAVLLLEDIARGQLYKVIHEGRIAALFALTKGPEADYETIRKNGSTKTSTRSSTASPQPEAGPIFQWALEQCPSLRVDTHPDNLPMRHVLEREGFSYIGDITLSDGTPRMCFHKLRPKPNWHEKG